MQSTRDFGCAPLAMGRPSNGRTSTVLRKEFVRELFRGAPESHVDFLENPEVHHSGEKSERERCHLQKFASWLLYRAPIQAEVKGDQ